MKSFLNFDIDLNHFIDELNKKIKNNNKTISKLLSNKNKTYQNFVKPMQDMGEDLECFFTPLGHINSVCNTKQTQDVYTQALPIITEYSTKLSQNLEIYKAYKNILKNEQNLNQEQKRVLELNILEFELSGASLDEKTKKRLTEINIALSELSNQFSQNVLDDINNYEYIIQNDKDIQGIPQSDIENAKFEQNGTIKYRFTLQMPSYIAYMTYGTNRNIREELYKAYVTKAAKNSTIIDKILSLRLEMSKLLGFENYASYSLATKMAKNTNDVINFLEKLLINSKKQANDELVELKKIAPKTLQSWDVAFYSEKLRKEKYDIDQEAYRVYFEQHSVIQGVFDFLEKLFNITFTKIEQKLWDNKAMVYDVNDGTKYIGRLYFDLEARKGKKNGAWMHNFTTHHVDSFGKKHFASAVVVCNFPPSTNSTPSLLRHDDVVTFFHEMGHALHHILSQVNESEISGVNGVEWDAVEFPSQFLENFAYEKEVLKLFAKHYKTKEVIPDEMIDKLIDAKNFLSATSMLRQLEFGLFDFKLHLKAYSGDEIQKLLDKIREDTAPIKPPSYNKFQNSFSHIFSGGYAAGYYSYKWAEVLSADTFLEVVKEGIFDSEIAKKYKELILYMGSSKSMSVLFEDLMQREPDVKNLLKLSAIQC